MPTKQELYNEIVAMSVQLLTIVGVGATARKSQLIRRHAELTLKLERVTQMEKNAKEEKEAKRRIARDFGLDVDAFVNFGTEIVDLELHPNVVGATFRQFSSIIEDALTAHQQLALVKEKAKLLRYLIQTVRNGEVEATPEELLSILDSFVWMLSMCSRAHPVPVQVLAANNTFMRLCREQGWEFKRVEKEKVETP